jgi:hypothetical protein
MLKNSMGDNYLVKMMNNPKEVINTVEKKYKNVNTLKSHFAKIGCLAEAKARNNTEAESIKKIYIDRMYKYDQINKNKIETNEKSDKQKKDWLSWNRILKVRDDLYKHRLDSKIDMLNNLIISLYTYLPPVRNNYAKLLITKTIPDENTFNYLYINPRNLRMSITLNKYKTAKTYGPITLEIPHKLALIIHEWIAKYPSKYLISWAGKPYDNQSLGVKITKIFEDKTGKRIGASMLRHIYITDVVNKIKTVKEKRKIATIMGHSLAQQMLYSKI